MVWRCALCEICVAWASATVCSEKLGGVLRGHGVYGECSKCGPGPGPGLSAIGSDQSCQSGHVAICAAVLRDQHTCPWTVRTTGSGRHPT